MAACRTEAKALEESTQELRMIESLIQPGSLGFGQRPWYDTAVPMEIMSSRPVGPETEPELWKEEEEGLRPSKWRRPDAKGQGDTGKGHSQQQDWTYAKSWSSNEWGNDWTNAQAGGELPQGNPSPEAQNGSPDYACSPARQSADDRRPGQIVHDLRANRCGGELGGDPLRGRATVERAENHIPREAHSSHAGDTHPEAAQRGCGPLQQDHGLRGQDLAGSTAGVGDRAGDAGGHEMGSGTSQACSERPVRPAGSCRGETTPSGYDSVECKPPGGESFPCNPANGRAVLFPHHELHDGCGTEDQGSWRNVASTQQAVPLLGMGDEWSLSSPCTVDEGHHGSARGTGSGRPEGSGQRQRAKGQPRRGETQILSSILINRSNHCYTNALVRSLQFLPVQCDSEGILPPKMGGLLKGFRAAAKPVVIWDNPFWKAVFGRWRNRDMQHDVADFLAHMIQCCPEMPSLLGVEWEARTSENGLIETRDRGCSLPLSVSPSSEVLSGRSMTTVQRVVDDWCRQEARHAAIVIPKVLVLQLGRFDRDAVGAVTRKWMYDIIPDRVLMFPVFDGEWGVTQVPMRLSSVIMHRGETPQTGHYRTILNVNDQLMLADDNCQIRLCEAGDLSAMNTDSYLFFYRLI